MQNEIETIDRIEDVGREVETRLDGGLWAACLLCVARSFPLLFASLARSLSLLLFLSPCLSFN